MDEKTIESFDGTKIHYRIQRQKGPFLLLLHGGSGSSAAWYLQVPYLLDKGYSLIILDQRGHGLSGRGEDLSFYQVDRFVQDVKAVLDSENIDQAVLIGHSFGSLVSQRFYHLYPQKVKALVLISTKFRNVGFNLSAKLLNLVMSLVFRFSKKQLPNDHYTDYSRFINSVDLSPRRILRDIECCSYKTYAGVLLTGNRFENPEYPEIECKTLLLHGRKDTIFSYNPIEKAASEKENFEFLLLDTNHIALFNQPNQINQLIGDFLNKI